MTLLANGLRGETLVRQRCMRKRNMVIDGTVLREAHQKPTSRAVAFRG